MQKDAKKILDIWKGGGGPEKKIMLIFPLKIESYMIFCGVDADFPWGRKGGPEKFLRWNFFASGPPLQVFVNSPLEVHIDLHWSRLAFHVKHADSLYK